MSELILQAYGLTKTFGKTPAMRGIDFALERGEVVAIMGPSGSGKSTLLHTLAGISLPNTGKVIYKGKNICKLSDAKRTILRRSDFGFVFQFSQLVPELSALDNIAVPLLLGGTSKKTAYAKAAKWLERVGLSSHADALPGQLSGGEAQRVAIARALCAQPKVLFADEPTGSLDSLNSEAVITMLLQLARENMMSVVLVTHEPIIASYADREVVVRDGKIEA